MRSSAYLRDTYSNSTPQCKTIGANVTVTFEFKIGTLLTSALRKVHASFYTAFSFRVKSSQKQDSHSDRQSETDIQTDGRARPLMRLITTAT